MNCADVGCGGGEVTLEIAKLVGAGGRALGIDMDPVKLELGRRAARDRGVTNVEFEESNANQWDQPDAYDLVYSRFLLHHLRRPADVVGRMWNAVRAQGLLIIEDADHDGWYCHPPNRGFDFFVRTLRESVDRGGGDHEFGRSCTSAFLRSAFPTLMSPFSNQPEPNRMGSGSRG
jgi:ubiquinone/menaquinone biosynthesis C-methylase UbiE